MKIVKDYTFVTILDQSYLVPISTKSFYPSDAIGFNETGAFIMSEIAKGVCTKEELIKSACKEFEAENQEEEKEVTEMVQGFVLDCIQKDYIEE